MTLSQRLAELVVNTPYPVDTVQLERSVRAIISDYADTGSITTESLIRSIVEGVELTKQLEVDPQLNPEDWHD